MCHFSTVICQLLAQPLVKVLFYVGRLSQNRRDPREAWPLGRSWQGDRRDRARHRRGQGGQAERRPPRGRLPAETAPGGPGGRGAAFPTKTLSGETVQGGRFAGGSPYLGE